MTRCTLALVLLCLPAVAQNVQVEATGTLTNNSLSTGPFAGIGSGAPVHLTMEVNTPGQVLAPGQYVSYKIDKPTFKLTVATASAGLGSGAPSLDIQNDFPVADGVHLFMTTMDVPGYFFEFELFDGTGGAIWSSTDITTLEGDYLPSLFQKAAWNINGGALSVALDLFTIHPPPPSAAVVEFGCGVNPAGSLKSKGLPTPGGSVTIGVHNPLGTQAPGSLSFLAAAIAPSPLFPCGFPVPGFGMAGGGAVGELLIAPGGPVVAGAPWSGTPAAFPVPIPDDASLLGVSLFLQGALLDLTPLALAPVGLTTAFELQIGV